MCTVCNARDTGFGTPTYTETLGEGFQFASIWTGAILAEDVYTAAANPHNKFSIDYDSAAAKISRYDVKWDDEDVFTGKTENGNYNQNALGTPGTVTYGYVANADISSLDVNTPSDHRQFHAAEIARVEYAISLIEEVANITFMRIVDVGGTYLNDPDDAEIRLIGQKDTNGGWASWSAWGDELQSSTVNIGEYRLEDPGSYAFLTAIHEIGHALGLAHPGDYNGAATNGYDNDAEYFEDSRQFSVMSYWDESETDADYGYRYPGNVMLHDIAALQRLYGLNPETRKAGTTYGFNSNTGDEGWSHVCQHGRSRHDRLANPPTVPWD